ncbi:MAG TPA: DUF1223 domain-containing protein [Caulobacteraceae bacterium]|jgi:hypothetical protein
MKRALAASFVLTAALAAGAALAWTPVVVELYTAQGCASCDKSNAYAASLADRPGVTALTFNVDYWDYLGWKDTFAQPEFADRQRAYDKRFGLRDVYTPQIVVAGQTQASGDKQGDVDDAIRSARKAPDMGPKITPRADGTFAVGEAAEARRRHADDVWLVRYDPHVQTVVVKAGDNRGKTVTHRNVVRQLVRLGSWTGRRSVFHLPAAPEDGLTTVILVQGPDGGRVIAALKRASGA